VASSNGDDKKRRKLTVGDVLTYIFGLLFFLLVLAMITVKWWG